MSHVLITGGAGFIGTNLADRLARRGEQVVVLDNLSRAGVEQNLEWLKGQHPDGVRAVLGDVRDRATIERAIEDASAVFHFAAQVAVTTSLVDPRNDFSINAGGTLNVLEALRRLGRPVPLLYTSTNKVYGGLEDLGLIEGEQRYAPADLLIARHGVSERRALDFHSPYGCSKGSADQYVIDYARSYGLKNVVFRMSCTYGPHQFGNEDQGWVAHFLIRALAGEPLTVYGDGKQVRDLLFVEDLVDAFVLARESIDRVAGQAFNIGGGPENTISLLELLDLIEVLQGRRPHVAYDNWRTGDQRYYVSDTAKFRAATGWAPRYDVKRGVARLNAWLVENHVAAEPEAHP